jgi:PhzF family phenazine biosynthesis protein
MGTSLPLFVVDAFADRAFAGNPAAVCLMPPGHAHAHDARWMQLVAREMNLSETAFVSPRPDSDFNLRWFTPKVEVELCGHATLASAHVLWMTERLGPTREARFHTKSGALVARQAGKRIALELPAYPPEEANALAGLEVALGARPVWLGRSRFDFFIEVATEAELRALAPDATALSAIEGRGFIVTAKAASTGHDFVSRFFAPRVGVPEDPVTGSAHCALGPFWASRLGKNSLVGFQASDRTGVVHVEVVGDRVTLGGTAVTITRGELCAD